MTTISHNLFITWLVLSHDLFITWLVYDMKSWARWEMRSEDLLEDWRLIMTLFSPFWLHHSVRQGEGLQRWFTGPVMFDLESLLWCSEKKKDIQDQPWACLWTWLWHRLWGFQGDDKYISIIRLMHIFTILRDFNLMADLWEDVAYFSKF